MSDHIPEDMPHYNEAELEMIRVMRLITPEARHAIFTCISKMAIGDGVIAGRDLHELELGGRDNEQ